MSRIIDFAHDDATRLDVSGGKGASLAKSARELPVPPGVIVTAEAYDAVPRTPAEADHADRAGVVDGGRVRRDPGARDDDGLRSGLDR